MGRNKAAPITATPTAPKYQMTISRLTVDKLGIKLYDRVSAVIAEIVANSYDADATEVIITAPMGELLAEKHSGVLKDKGYAIEVSDNGIGMTPEEVNKFYLVVGAERRNDPRRGNISKKFQRKVMGRKGVGKIAPLGICQRIEILSSGGGIVKEGRKSGYRTAHLILEREHMMVDTGEAYTPAIGPEDGALKPQTGTMIRLSRFDHRRVPDVEEFDRQLAQRFGVESGDWKITLVDSQKTPGSPGNKRTVGQFTIQVKDNTRIEFKEEKPATGGKAPVYRAFGPDGNIMTDVDAYFEYEGQRYPFTP